MRNKREQKMIFHLSMLFLSWTGMGSPGIIFFFFYPFPSFGFPVLATQNKQIDALSKRRNSVIQDYFILYLLLISVKVHVPITSLVLGGGLNQSAVRAFSESVCRVHWLLLFCGLAWYYSKIYAMQSLISCHKHWLVGFENVSFWGLQLFGIDPTVCVT